VVSGVRTPQDLSEMKDVMPDAHDELIDILRTLERHYGDMQDVEFTVEEGHLYMLQTRVAKRPAQAAIRFAVDGVKEELFDQRQALMTIDADGLDALLHPTFDRDAEYEILAQGVPASPGAAKGEIAFSVQAARAAAQDGRDVILVRPFTEADDVAGFAVAKGIVTSEGGKASHAALVARGMGRPCVAGASLEIDLDALEMRADSTTLKEGDVVTIDGSSGVVTADDVSLVEASLEDGFDRVLEWADELRRLAVRANADGPEDACKARGFGAQGIGLCRTEHMFMAADRQPTMRAMVMAEDEDERRRALDELMPQQEHDFAGLFEEMHGLPVTIRLLDPPLHEFLPSAEDLARDVERARSEQSDDLEELEETLERVRGLLEVNPMLGMRGVRLGIVYPEIYEMQTRAMLRAARAVTEQHGEAPELEIMVPLVGHEGELERTRALIEQVAEEEGDRIRFRIGTMIELPRACFVADRIASAADFFSFGTNDLTQTTLGYSRDDVEAKFLHAYIDSRILDRSPFETIDVDSVGELIRMAVSAGRRTNSEISLGICGEHGGDPDSIRFFHAVGLDYVSCSPFRVPVARVAAAQAAIVPSQ
jgi:pyruvate,orthophosphate dikinase